jgi:hypothetical protein
MAFGTIDVGTSANDGTGDTLRAAFQTVNTNFEKVTLARKANVLAPHESLIVKYVSATSVDVDADALVLFDSGGDPKRFASVNLTVAITTAGANGLDTGSEGSSTWYAVWAIGKTDGTIAAVLSASFSSPTLPAGYTYFGFIGAVYNNSSSNFVAFLQRGNVAEAAGVVVLNSGSATTYTAVDLSAAVPPNATAVNLIPYVLSASGTIDVQFDIAGDGTTITATYGKTQIILPATTTLRSGGTQWLLLSTAQQIEYFVAQVGGGANARGTITSQGWRF